MSGGQLRIIGREGEGLRSEQKEVSVDKDTKNGKGCSQTNGPNEKCEDDPLPNQNCNSHDSHAIHEKVALN